MVVDRLHSQKSHKFVESLGRVAFEKSICISFLPNPIHNVATIVVLFHHLWYNLHVVLQVSVNAHDDVGIIFGSSQTRHQRILMSNISRQFHPHDIF